MQPKPATEQLGAHSNATCEIHGSLDGISSPLVQSGSAESDAERTKRGYAKRQYSTNFKLLLLKWLCGIGGRIRLEVVPREAELPSRDGYISVRVQAKP
eukprot:6185419-Pleurochrysis_carterae.AAC.1